MSGVRVPPPFTYARPPTLDAALELIAEPGAMALAGGTDVVPMRASGRSRLGLLVDVKHVGELRGVTREPDGGVRIGAATTFRELDERDDPGLGAVLDGARIVGAEQTRARATLGGNLCRSSPAGDTLAGLIVTGAIAELRSLAGGSRDVPVAEFFTGPGRNVRRADELLIAIRIPPHDGASAYARFTYRESMDLAVVGVAVALSMAGRVSSRHPWPLRRPRRPRSRFRPPPPRSSGPAATRRTWPRPLPRWSPPRRRSTTSGGRSGTGCACSR